MAEHNLENQLRTALQGLQPSRDFIQTVEKRFRPPKRKIEIQRAGGAQRFTLAAGSVLAAFLIILTLTRVLYYLLGFSRRHTA